MKKIITSVMTVLGLLALSTPAGAVTGTVDQSFSGSVLTISSSAKSLAGTVGQYFSESFWVNGGSPVYQWTTEQALPAGLYLSTTPDTYGACANPAPDSGIQLPADCSGSYSSWQNVVVSGTPTLSGTYAVKFIVSDSASHKTASSFIFTIGGVGTDRGITVTSPQGGEVWALGSTHAITWADTTGSSLARPVHITLEPYIACLYLSPSCAVMQPASYTIATNISSSGSYSWTVPTDLASRYISVGRIIVSTTDGALTGASGVISISSAASPTIVRSGYVDSVSAMKVAGWAYDQASQPACVIIAYKTIFDIGLNKVAVPPVINQQVCPSASRVDAEEWLRKNYGSALYVQQPLGFVADPSTVLSAGTYVVQSVALAQSGAILQLSDAAKASFTIGTVSVSPLTLTTVSSLAGSVGQNFGAGFSVSGGSAPYQQWQVTSGSLPSGLALSFPVLNCFAAPCIAPKDTAYVSGVPTINGNFPFTLKVTDSAGRTVEQAFTITIGGVGTKTITVTADGSMQGVVGTPLSVTFSALNGTAPYTLQLDGGVVPPGTSFVSAVPACAQPADGSKANCIPTLYMLSGTPTTSGIYAFTVSATDAAGNKGSQGFKMVITSAAVARSLTVTTPQKDESWARGQAHTIRWTPSGSGSTMTISATRYIPCLHNETYVCAIAQPAPVVITTSASDSGSYVWNTPSDFALTGLVSVSVSNNATGQTGESASFQISEKNSTGACPFSAGQLVVGSVGTVYFITADCSKYGFTSYQDFVGRGYKFSQVQKVDQSAIDALPTVYTLSRPAGTTFKYQGKAAVYYLSTSLCKELYPSLATLRAWKLDIRDIVTIATSEQYPDCNPSYVRLPENTPVRASGNGTIYVIRTGARYPFGNIGAFYRAGFSFKQVVVIPTSELGLYPLGGILE